jgi:hypothetical protein
MKLKLTRNTYTTRSTIGELSIDGKSECFILEDPVRPEKVKGETAIPAGSYEVIITHSPRFERDLPLLLDVPNYEGVRIHTGNTATDTEGCLLPGRSKAVDFVGDSRAAFNGLFAKIRAALKSGDKVTMEIIEGGVSPFMPAAQGAERITVAVLVAQGWRVLADPLRLRAKDDDQSEILARLPHGMLLDGTGQPSKRGWVHVKAVLGGAVVEGYVSQDFVEPFAFAPDPSVPLPKKGELTPTSAADSAEQLFRVNDIALNLRKKPEADKDSHIIARLPRGHLVTRLAVVKDAPLWWEVSTIVEGESLRGFVHSGLLEPQASSISPATASSVVESSEVQLTEKALDLIIEFEGIDQAGKWPGGGSGISLGVGYDLGYKSLDQFRSDWGRHLSDEQIGRLSRALGKRGEAAKKLASGLADIRVTRVQGEEVFLRGSVPVIKADTLKAFPGIKRLPGDVQGALCSLVFNRGGDMTGDRRLEMRLIRDAIVDSSLTMKQRLLSIEASIRAMERIWRGTDVGRGLIKRRNAEADLVRSCA